MIDFVICLDDCELQNLASNTFVSALIELTPLPASLLSSLSLRFPAWDFMGLTIESCKSFMIPSLSHMSPHLRFPLRALVSQRRGLLRTYSELLGFLVPLGFSELPLLLSYQLQKIPPPLEHEQIR